MCKRKDAVKDPLANLLFTRYGLHMLNVPRAGIEVGDVLVHTQRSIVGTGRVDNLFERGFVMPAVAIGERAISLQDARSNELDARLGLQLLDKLLAAIGFGDAAKVHAEYAAKGATKLRLRFDEPTRDSVDILLISDRLAGGTPKPHQFKDGESLYLVTGVLRSRGLSISAQAASGQGVDVSAQVTALAAANGKLAVAKVDDTELIFRGTDPLGFGVELVELTYDPQANRIDRRGVDQPIRVRAGIDGVNNRGLSFIGDGDDELFIDVDVK
jgi:hypothetical protein